MNTFKITNIFKRQLSTSSSRVRHSVWILMLSLLLGLPTAGNATIIFVDVFATGNNDGSSFADAFTDLQDALAIAVSGDEIWVSEGIYLPHPSDRTISFDLKDGISVYGGFMGSPSETLANRLGGETILSGDLKGDDIPGDLETNKSDNSNHVVRATNVTVLLDRLTIERGFANEQTADAAILDEAEDLNGENASHNLSEYESNGAGILALDSNLTLNQMIIRENQANCHLVPDRDLFGDLFPVGTALDENGDAWDRNAIPYAPLRVRCKVGTGDGGGIHLQRSTLTMQDSIVTNNVAAKTTRAPVDTVLRDTEFNRDGGGIVVDDASSATISNSDFSNNVAFRGGAIFLRSGAHTFPAAVHSTLTVTDSDFTDNFANHRGGAIGTVQEAVIHVRDSTFSLNKAETPTGKTVGCSGGAISINGGREVSTISNNTFTENEALAVDSACMGGAIGNLNTSAIISGNTFIRNKGLDGGAILNQILPPSIEIREAFVSYVNLSHVISNNTFQFNEAKFNASSGGGGFAGAVLLQNFTQPFDEAGNPLPMTETNNTATLSNNVYIGNTADLSGGAMAVDSMKSTLTNDFFSNNFAFSFGGGAITQSATTFISKSLRDSGIFPLFPVLVGPDEGGDVPLVVIDSGTFVNNTALAFGGGALAGVGGALGTTGGIENIGVFFSLPDLGLAQYEIKNSTFDGNMASRRGGVIALTNTVPAFFGLTTSLKVENTSFANNRVGIDGGAIYNKVGEIQKFKNATFTMNVAANDGGAIWNAGHLHMVKGTGKEDTNFTGNSAGNDGGAIMNSISGVIDKIQFALLNGNTAGNDGGAIANHGIITKLKHSNFVGNVADSELNAMGSGNAINTVPGGLVTVSQNTFDVGPPVQDCVGIGAGPGLPCSP